ncbi:MAG: ABC transporter ATP-binding protein [Gammaproteobacteria bacterium]|nr:MAG: ABC transporter ATP-binding protein [Gammaproteobacteria bacterium]
MLELRNVNSGYGSIQALHDISFTINQGEIVTLIGANGAGKSTTLMTLCGDISIISGQIVFENEDISSLKPHEIMRKGIAISPEGRRVFPKLTVEENLMLGAYFTPEQEAAEMFEKVLELFPRLKERISQQGGTLSGGEQQMLAIGRALMAKPKLLLLDEPSLGLAPLIINLIFEVLADIRDQGTTVFLVEQNAHKALALADRGYVLENGRIVKEGRGKDLSSDPAVKEAYLGGH